jgi:hypothetical protein
VGHTATRRALNDWFGKEGLADKDQAKGFDVRWLKIALRSDILD